ncbi:hypothetical protein GLIP_0699 [Aliiglaciecola lipolytica E3]|uniref:Ice-binding protein C-terminal domain-containing protein n=2 Tax=Aliiglaciecola TaxID=1406885 RepID=K6YPX1_9ALTE|nr:hypothetical protein GLIP_0699 [Aliiglaciecola lipolytica E3]
MDSNFNSSDLQGAFNLLPAGSVSELASTSNFNTGQDTVNLLSFNFDMSYVGEWTLDAGLDAGFGAELFLDGVLVAERTDNLWWSNSWNNSDVFSVTLNNISIGEHTVELYWAEDCCSGNSSIRLTDARTGNVSALSSEAIAAASIPEPAGILLMSLGLLALARRR